MKLGQANKGVTNYHGIVKLGQANKIENLKIKLIEKG
jgi:hypothetical protein